jgi:HAE1 family hydrophobic/amphiphilic exporter-1
MFGSGEGAELRAPMAITVVCGLLSSTLLTLIVIPVVYSLVMGLLDRGAPASNTPTDAGLDPLAE